MPRINGVEIRCAGLRCGLRWDYQIAGKVGINPQMLSRILSGKREVDDDMIERICVALDVHRATIMDSDLMHVGNTPAAIANESAIKT